MNSAQQAVVDNPYLEKFIANIFEIVRKGKSMWVKEGTGGDTGTPAQHMNTNQFLMLEPISRLFLGKGKGYMPTQYVVGAPTHYVNDYYEDKDGNFVFDRVTADQAKAKGYQLRMGLKSLGYNLKEEYANSMGMDICFKFGGMDARTYGDDPVFLRWLMEHEQNEVAPNAKDNRDPKRLKLFQFRPSIPELKAAKSKVVENFDDDLEAMAFVGKTREKTDKGFKYNEPVLTGILAMLEDGGRLAEGEVLQKFELVARWARKDGAEFMRIVKGTIDDYKIDILAAEELKVIAFGAKEVKFKDGGGRSILALDSTKKEENISQLTYYFAGTKPGQADYAEMQRLVEVAKMEAMKN